ncbi:MAG: glutamate--cysteine ligase [Noviherbaspirillum sp.]
MSKLLTRRLDGLASTDHRALLTQGLRGVERETLRVAPDGALALTPHPRALGAALTHSEITTDYSESLLEFITPPEHDIADGLRRLDAIHRFASSAIGNELLWSQSMPCRLPEEERIPIAWYGVSHIGMLKHVYRRGLALRYGKAMQCIAGIHYNFSVAEPLWEALREMEGVAAAPTHYQSESYIALMRNFHRYSWLLMVLFGASPVVSAHFLGERPHGLEKLSEDTLYLPYATSLRMSDLGYQNHAQAGLMRPYNTLRDYMCSLSRAVRQPYAPYEKIGTRRDGEWVQINANLLQIENEYYATIRPKRVIHSGERPLEALCTRGVQYIEARCLDVDPFDPLGISLETARFMDAFLLFCALDESPLTNLEADRENTRNFSLAVKEGRRPGLLLQRGGEAVALRAWGEELLDRIGEVAAVLDRQGGQGGGTAHAQTLARQREKLRDPSQTPSARVLDAVHAEGGSFAAFGMRQSLAHAASFRARPLSDAEHAAFAAQAAASLEEQERMERTQNGDFDQFILDYRARTPPELCG